MGLKIQVSSIAGLEAAIELIESTKSVSSIEVQPYEYTTVGDKMTVTKVAIIYKERN